MQPRCGDLKYISVHYSDRGVVAEPRPDQIVVFLAGVTPAYPRATWSWRDKVIADLDRTLGTFVEMNDMLRKHFPVLLICPEPSSRNWANGPDDQIDWEQYWLQKSHIVLLWHETRWQSNDQTRRNCYMGADWANIGIQFRFEVGQFLCDQSRVRIVYRPPHAEQTAAVEWWLRKTTEPRHRFHVTETEVDTVRSLAEAIVVLLISK